MTADLSIRHAVEKDLEALLELYTHLAEGNAPYRLAQARETFARFLRYEGSAIVLGETEELPVASCTVVVVPNLTRGCKPYALIENVVTHRLYRGCGFGKAVLDFATHHAWKQGCYKAMLLSGSQDPNILGFYQSAGFEQSKTGFQKRRPF